MPSLNVPRDSASMVCFKGALYVVGGLKSSNCGALSVEMFDSVADQWQEKSNIPVKGKKETICFNACFATVHKNCLDDKNNSTQLHGIEAPVVLNDNMDNG